MNGATEEDRQGHGREPGQDNEFVSRLKEKDDD
jgi:hypothetical protein